MSNRPYDIPEGDNAAERAILRVRSDAALCLACAGDPDAAHPELCCKCFLTVNEYDPSIHAALHSDDDAEEPAYYTGHDSPDCNEDDAPDDTPNAIPIPDATYFVSEGGVYQANEAESNAIPAYVCTRCKDTGVLGSLDALRPNDDVLCECTETAI